MVSLMGAYGSFTGNTITTNSGGPVLELQGMSHGTVTGNSFYELRTSAAPWALNIWDSRNSTVSGNVFTTAATTHPVFHYQGTNSNIVLTHNVLRHN
jgi:hypothetical protein